MVLKTGALFPWLPIGAWLLLLNACVDTTDIKFLEPAPAAMLPAGQEVSVLIQASDDQIELQGTSLAGDGTFQAQLPPADGLGFAVAAIPGDEMIAVRSWHQGDYLDAHRWHEDTVQLILGPAFFLPAPAADQLTAGDLISELLSEEELAPFFDSALQLTVAGLLPIQIQVESAKAAKAGTELTLTAQRLHFRCTLEEVLVRYGASAPLITSTGSVHYSAITITGDLALGIEGVSSSAITVVVEQPRIEDAGDLPQIAVEALLQLFNQEIKGAISRATAGVIEQLFSDLLSALRPSVGQDFPRPIMQETEPLSLTLDLTGLHLSYQTRIEAVTSLIARQDHGVLRRPPPVSHETAAGLSLIGGAALMNQYIYAVWDAGNLEALTFTEGELVALGMEELGFPYSNMDRAVLSLLLPPLLEWREDGPVLELGGVTAQIEVSDGPDTRLWTGVGVPIMLVADGLSLRLEVDSSRALRPRQVGLDQLSVLASYGELLRLMQTAVPGVVTDVFGALPAIELPRITFPRLDGSPGPTVRALPSAVTPRADHWQIVLTLQRVE